MTTNERRIRLWANHLALTVHRRGKQLDLRERHADNGYSKRLIGTFRSWRALEGGLNDYMEQEGQRLNLELGPETGERVLAS